VLDSSLSLAFNMGLRLLIVKFLFLFILALVIGRGVTILVM